MNRFIPIIILAVATACSSPRAWADIRKDEAEKPKAPVPMTVAVLDFEANTPGDANLGKHVSEILVEALSGQDGVKLVDRASMDRILAEHELNLTGLVNAGKTTKIGELVGAKILITGKIFLLDKQTFITAKLIGTETSLLDGVLVKGDKDADIGELLMKLADKVAVHLHTVGPTLIVNAAAIEDPLPGLKKALAGHKLPKIAVSIPERHITTAPAIRIDPAAETEIRKVLKDAGFTIIEGNEKELTSAGVTIAITGEASSEFNTRFGSLVSCSARLEIKAIDRKTGEVLFVDRETTRGVDLAENMAARSALQKAGHIVAIRILRRFEHNDVRLDAP